MELVPELHSARRIHGWIPRRADLANGGTFRSPEISEARPTCTKCRPACGYGMRILYADLEREWRGGQSQAFLTLQGLARANHEVALLAPERSALAERAAQQGITVHASPRIGLRAQAAQLMARLSIPTTGTPFALAHINEPH